MKKTIIFVIDSLGDGGAEKAVITQAEGFYKKGYSPYIITLRNNVSYEIPDGIKYLSMAFKKGIGAFRMITDMVLKNSLKLKLKKIIDNENVEAVFSHLIFSDTMLSTMNLGVPTFFVIHNNYSTKYLETRKGMRKWIKWHKLKQTYNGKDLITVSDGVYNDILGPMNLKPSSIHTIHNPFPHEKIKKLADKKPSNAPDDYIINVSAFRKQKRHDVLLKAYALSGIASKLVLLGSGSENDIKKIKSMTEELGIKDKVIIPGFQSNPYAWMKHAKLFVLSSDFEGFPLVVVESIISGTPVISTNCPSGPQEVLKDHPELLSPVGDAHALAKNIKKYSESPPAIDEKCVRPFFLENIIEKLEKVIQSQKNSKQSKI